MILGILSDTHNELDRTERAVQLLRAAGAETLIHCGDLASPFIVRACACLPLYFVLGNHDADAVPELRQAATECGARCLGWGGTIELGGKRVGVLHGHLTSDIRHVLSERPDYLLSGHLHAPFDLSDGPVRRINPGALFRADRFTVALLDLDSDGLTFLEVDPAEPMASVSSVS